MDATTGPGRDGGGRFELFILAAAVLKGLSRTARTGRVGVL